ncbi:MAG: glutathione peroxidase, partial [Synechococcaceae bacterium WB4_1_0192]|nr:glutathione peroxidase [Synechococcaceae bacterium WB4_1_0192]
MAVNVSAVQVNNASGEPQTLGAFAGQVVLIVNVASRCGFTRQYAGLQSLQESYGPKGFSV